MSNTSNQIKEAEQKVAAARNELIEILAEARARGIIEEFTVVGGCIKYDIEKIDFENRTIEIGDIPF